MEIIKKASEIHSTVRAVQKKGKTVGFVPSMGGLHEGHGGLIQHSVNDNDVTAVSVFVNPTQFDSSKAVRDYPGVMEEDRTFLKQKNVDLLFLPEHREIYPEGDSTHLQVNLDAITRYEGEFRDRFFDGVTRVVSKLLNIIPSDRVYFGEKDLQQYVVIRRMIRDLHFPQELNLVPVVRDENGVAYSTRNQQLTSEEWELAADVYEIMRRAKQQSGQLPREQFIEQCRENLQRRGFDLDYIDVIQYPNFTPTEPVDRGAVLIVAGYPGEIRLKDNLPLNVDRVGELENHSTAMC